MSSPQTIFPNPPSPFTYVKGFDRIKLYKVMDYGIAITLVLLFAISIVFMYAMYKRVSANPMDMDAQQKLAWSWKFMSGIVASAAIFYASGLYWTMRRS